MLAIDWNSREVRILEGKVVRGELKVSHASTTVLPSDLNPSDAEAWGQFLKSSLKNAGVSSRSAVTCLERRSVVLKTVPLAGVAEEEIADVVRLQGMRDLTIPVEDTTLDYLKVDPATTTEEPHALLAAVKTELVDFYKRVFAAAGLNLTGLWPGSLARVRAAALTGALPGLKDNGDVANILLVVTDGDSVELSLLRGEHFLMSVSRPVSRADVDGSGGQPVRQVIRRLYASLSSQYPALRLDAVVCTGFENPTEVLGEEMIQQFGADPVIFDPLASLNDSPIPPAERGAFASVVGSIVIASEPPKSRINFLTPKKAVPKQDRRRIYAIAAAGIVLFAGLQIHRYYTTQRDELVAAVTQAKATEKKMRAELKKLEAAKAQAQLVESWQAQEVVWLNLIREFFDDVPEARQLFLTQMSLSRSSRATGPSATIRIEGFADTQETVTAMTRRLMEDGRFEVHPGAIQPSGRFEGYSWRFSADIGVRREPTNTKTSKS